MKPTKFTSVEANGTSAANGLSLSAHAASTVASRVGARTDTSYATTATTAARAASAKVAPPKTTPTATRRSTAVSEMLAGHHSYVSFAATPTTNAIASAVATVKTRRPERRPIPITEGWRTAPDHIERLSPR